jgi:uncharacterized membrane protein
MGKGRLEAFSDGVLAIIITIMVLELHVPHEPTLEALVALCPKFVSYVLSFVYVGIYWNNHHHLIHTVKRVSGGLLWANLHLLFWLSLFPFVTAWVGEHPEAPLPAATYGVVLLAAALAWLVVQRSIIAAGGGTLRKAIGFDWKGKLSPVFYIAGIGASVVRPWISALFYAAVALIWVVPDRRIESQLDEH